MKKVAIIQSSYIPWKGFFDIIHDVDEFILYDNIPISNSSDWRNRNRIKTADGVRWLTIPVGPRGHQLICEVNLHDPSWQSQHWRMMEASYSDAPSFSTYRNFFEHVFMERAWSNLSELNHFLIRQIASDYLGIRTKISDARGYAASSAKTDRLIELLTAAGADIYISGPSARTYINETRFRDAGIELVYKDYSGYPEYPQPYPPFIHEVSIVDLLFQTGADAPFFIWGWRGADSRQRGTSTQKDIPEDHDSRMVIE